MTFDPLAPPPLVTADLPGIGGRLKSQPEDFEVEEVPAYEPSGQGDFLYLWVEKRGVGAEYFARLVARKLAALRGVVSRPRQSGSGQRGGVSHRKRSQATRQRPAPP